MSDVTLTNALVDDAIREALADPRVQALGGKIIAVEDHSKMVANVISPDKMIANTVDEAKVFARHL